MSHGSLEHNLEISVGLSTKIYLGQTVVPELPAPLLQLEPAELLTHLDQAFGGSGPLEQARRELWHRAVTRAYLARALGQARGLDPRLCFTLGLLSELGLLLAVSCAEQVILERGTPVPPWTALWTRLASPQARRLSRQAFDHWAVPRALRDLLETGAQAVPRQVSEATALLHTVHQLQQLVCLHADGEPIAVQPARVTGIATTEQRAVQQAVERIPALIGQLPSEMRRAGGQGQLLAARQAPAPAAGVVGSMGPAARPPRSAHQCAAA